MIKYRENKNIKICNLYLLKKLIVPVICVFLAGAFSKPAEASAKNPDDVAKLQKFVNERKAPLMYNISGIKMETLKR